MFAQAFAKIRAVPLKLRALSLAARASWLLAIFLVVTVLVVGIAFLTNPNLVPWRHSWTWQRCLGVLGLVCLIPPVVYKALQLWLEGELSPFADIDYAWRAGREELARNGLALDQIPIFLVLGSASEVQERSIMGATRLGFRVKETPPGPAPLHWYANPDGIYLVCSGVGLLSKLAHESERSGTQAAALGPAPANLRAPERAPAATPAPSTDRGVEGARALAAGNVGGQTASKAPAPAPLKGGNGDSVKGTIMADAYNAPAEPRSSGPAAATARGGKPRPIASTAMLDRPLTDSDPALRGTMMANSYQGQESPTAPAPAATAPAAREILSTVAAARRGIETGLAATVERKVLQVSAQDSREQAERLAYVGKLLRRARGACCAVNGIITLLPFELIQAGQEEAVELQRVIRSDLSTLQRGLEVRCPVSALVVGMERERGFLELVRRVGPDRASAQRFGKRFDVRVTPSPEELEALSAHACGAFEDWVYSMFREKGALSKSGNTRLYGLLCQVRRHLQTRLADILAGGYGHDAQQHRDTEAMLFSGCYFAATGSQPDKQAFVQGVFEKLPEEQESIAWTARALADERRYLRLAYLGMLIASGLVVTLGTLVVRRLLAL